MLIAAVLAEAKMAAREKDDATRLNASEVTLRTRAPSALDASELEPALTKYTTVCSADTAYMTAGTMSRHRNRRISSLKPGWAKSPPHVSSRSGASIGRDS